MKNIIIKHAAINAGLTTAYIVGISFFLNNIQHIFPANKPDTVLAPIFMLSLLVFSVAMMGILIFGRPILWYLDGKKKEAVTLLAYTLGVFLLLTLVVAAITYFVVWHGVGRG